MNMQLNRWTMSAGGAVVAILLAGCAGVQNPSGTPVTEMKADERGFVAGTGVESQDLVRIADKMARGILTVPQISRAQNPPTVVLKPVINETRFAINKDIFLTRIRAQLNSQVAGRIVFLENNQRAADYNLTGKLASLTTRTAKGTSDYVLYTFQLVDPRTSAIVWEGFEEIKKQGLEDAAYR